jgi:TonB family protein
MFWIVYKGLGFWVPIVLVVCLLVVFLGEIALIAGPTHVFDDRQTGLLEPGGAYLPAAVSFILAGAICLLWGMRVNRLRPIDAFAKVPTSSPDHSLYFMKMQYWGVLFLAFGACFLWQTPPEHPLLRTSRNTPYTPQKPEMPPATTLQSPQPPAGHFPRRLRVDPAEQAKRILQLSPPVYPALAEQARIQGEVRMDAIIGKDGRVKELSLVSGHPMLAPAAEQAAMRWVYEPALLNGEPIEVTTQIEVDFSLKRR